MPSPYSYDLRIRVIAAVEKGMEVKEASRTLWAASRYHHGVAGAQRGHGRGASERGLSSGGHSHKIPAPEQFQAFVQAHGEATLEELAEAGGGVKRMTIWRQLRKVGYPHKKRPFAIPSGTKS